MGLEASKDASYLGGKELKITDIRQAVRNENRVNVYVNNKYSFSLDIAQVVELSIKVGKLIDGEDLAEVRHTRERWSGR